MKKFIYAIVATVLTIAAGLAVFSTSFKLNADTTNTTVNFVTYDQLIDKTKVGVVLGGGLADQAGSVTIANSTNSQNPSVLVVTFSTPASPADSTTYTVQFFSQTTAVSPQGVTAIPEGATQLTGVVSINSTDLGKNLVVFKGAAQTEELMNDNKPLFAYDKFQQQYFVLAEDNFNQFVFFISNDGKYTKGTGLHQWGGVNNASGWGEPNLTWQQAASIANIPALVYQSYTTAESNSLGLIIHDGDNKYTGNMQYGTNSGAATLGEKAGANGQFSIVFVYNKGTTAPIDNVILAPKVSEFITRAFKFELKEFVYNQDQQSVSGTGAINTTNIQVQAASASLLVTQENAPQAPGQDANSEDKSNYETAIKAWEEKIQGLLKQEIIIKDNDNNVVEISKFVGEFTTNQVNSFIIQLATPLEVTKTYTISVDNTAQVQGALEAKFTQPLNTVTKLPQVSYGDLDTQTDSDGNPIVIVAYNKLWNNSYVNIKLLKIVDQRDSNSYMVSTLFVKSSEQGNKHYMVDTATKGNYLVQFTVQDAYGYEGTIILDFQVQDVQ